MRIIIIPAALALALAALPFPAAAQWRTTVGKNALTDQRTAEAVAPIRPGVASACSSNKNRLELKVWQYDTISRAARGKTG